MTPTPTSRPARSTAALLTSLVATVSALPLPAQLRVDALQLSTATATVDADLVVFRLDVTDPDGIWLEDQAPGGRNWIYRMDAQWMSRLGDQQPALQAAHWSLPNVHGGNAWAFGFVAEGPQHLLPGSYLMVMADDTNEPGRDPSPVAPAAVPQRFVHPSVELEAVGFAIDPGANAALARPPFAGLDLQPCDLTGWFPFALRGGTPPRSTAWVAGADIDTCSGLATPSGGALTGFHGWCSRWLVWSRSTPASGAIDLLAFRQNLVLANGKTLPQAIAGVALLHVADPATAPVAVDLGALAPGLFPDGGFQRLAAGATASMTLLNGSNLTVSTPVPPGLALQGLHLFAQVAALDAGLTLHASDLTAVPLW